MYLSLKFCLTEIKKDLNINLLIGISCMTQAHIVIHNWLSYIPSYN